MGSSSARPRVSPHGLRGTHSTLAQEAGQSAAAVAQQLGHEDVRTTERSYTAPGTSAQARARRAGVRLMRGGKG